MLLTLWQRFGAWLERRGPKEGVAAQTFFTVNVALGTALCFGLRPVLAGCRDWLRWRLEARRERSRHRGYGSNQHSGSDVEEWICAGDDGVVIWHRKTSPHDPA